MIDFHRAQRRLLRVEVRKELAVLRDEQAQDLFKLEELTHLDLLNPEP